MLTPSLKYLTVRLINQPTQIPSWFPVNFRRLLSPLAKCPFSTVIPAEISEIPKQSPNQNNDSAPSTSGARWQKTKVKDLSTTSTNTKPKREMREPQTSEYHRLAIGRTDWPCTWLCAGELQQAQESKGKFHFHSIITRPPHHLCFPFKFDLSPWGSPEDCKCRNSYHPVAAGQRLLR